MTHASPSPMPLGASEAGAVVLNHASVRSLVIEEGKARGALVVDHLSGQEAHRSRPRARQRHRPVER